MKTKIGILVLALCTTFINVQAQRRMVTTTRATSSDISDNLDLDAVASIFGDSENLEDFEHRLNDPNNPISNLDLNEDGYIDYLRVVENSSARNSLVVVQAVLGDNVFQDVATIEVERGNNGNFRIQIVGDDYIYGSNYIIEPVFYRTPLIFSFFWGPRYSPWRSPYYWNNYPRWYSYYRPYSPFKYRRHIFAHINFENKYHRATDRSFHFSGDNYNQIRRNDYGSKYPERAFENRNRGINNRNELIERRPNRFGNNQQNNNISRPNNRVRPDSPNIGSGNRPVNESRRPEIQEKSGQTQTGENNRNLNRNRPQVKEQEQKKNESYRRSEESRSPSVSTPERSTNRVESTKGSSAPRDRSGSVKEQRRSAKEVKSNRKEEKKSDSSKEESQRRRRE